MLFGLVSYTLLYILFRMWSCLPRTGRGQTTGLAVRAFVRVCVVGELLCWRWTRRKADRHICIHSPTDTRTARPVQAAATWAVTGLQDLQPGSRRRGKSRRLRPRIGRPGGDCKDLRPNRDAGDLGIAKKAGRLGEIDRRSRGKPASDAVGQARNCIGNKAQPSSSLPRGGKGGILGYPHTGKFSRKSSQLRGKVNYWCRCGGKRRTTGTQPWLVLSFLQGQLPRECTCQILHAIARGTKFVRRKCAILVQWRHRGVSALAITWYSTFRLPKKAKVI